MYRDGREARRGVIKSKRLPSSALARLQALPARAAALPGLDALWLFGSHARGDATPLSDVDLAYLEDLEAPRRDRTPAFDARIYDALSGFLGTDEISLVDLETAPPALALRVFREGKLLFCRNPRHVADVLERVLIRYPEVRRLIVQGLEAGSSMGTSGDCAKRPAWPRRITWPISMRRTPCSGGSRPRSKRARTSATT